MGTTDPESITIKVTHAGQTRRNTFKRAEVTFDGLSEWISTSFEVPLNVKPTRLSYKDPENDVITIGSNDELGEALRLTPHPSTLSLSLTFPRSRERWMNRLGEAALAADPSATEQPAPFNDIPEGSEPASPWADRWAQKCAWRRARLFGQPMDRPQHHGMRHGPGGHHDHPGHPGHPNHGMHGAAAHPHGMPHVGPFGFPPHFVGGPTAFAPYGQHLFQHGLSIPSPVPAVPQSEPRNEPQHRHPRMSAEMDKRFKKQLNLVMILLAMSIFVFVSGWLRPVIAPVLAGVALAVTWKIKKAHHRASKMRKRHHHASLASSAPTAPVPAAVPAPVSISIPVAAPDTEPRRRVRSCVRASATLPDQPTSSVAVEQPETPAPSSVAEAHCISEANPGFWGRRHCQRNGRARHLASPTVVLSSPTELSEPNQPPALVEPAADSYTPEAHMATLREMGFTDDTRNRALLTQFRSIELVLRVLLRSARFGSFAKKD